MKNAALRIFRYPLQASAHFLQHDPDPGAWWLFFESSSRSGFLF